MDFPDAAQKWDARYSGSDGFLFGEQPNAWLARQCEWLSPGSKVCCLADGEGRNSVWLARQGHIVSAFDLSPVAVARGQKLAAQHQVSTDARVASIEQWIDQVEPASLDAIVAIFIQFAGPALRESLFNAIRCALRPGGVLIIEGYGQRQLQFRTGGPGAIENLYDVKLISNAFQSWPTLAGRDVEVMLAEGSGHLGRSHVLSAVVRKPA